MDDFDLEKMAEAIPQTIIDFLEDYFSQFDYPDDNHPDSETLWEIAMLYLVYEEGEKYALLEALRLSCELKQSPIPHWVAEKVQHALNDWLELEVKTLDTAFEVEKPKNYRFDAARKKYVKSPKIYSQINKLSKLGRPIDDNLFDEVGADFGVGSTLAKEYYYGHKRLLKAALIHIPKFLK